MANKEERVTKTVDAEVTSEPREEKTIQVQLEDQPNKQQTILVEVNKEPSKSGVINVVSGTQTKDERNLQKRKEAHEAQLEKGTVFDKEIALSPKDLHDQWKKDVGAFMKKLRGEFLLDMTMEKLADQLGVSKGQIVKMEKGQVDTGRSIILLFFDLVRSKLIEKRMQWYDLGEHSVDNFISDAYKKRRGWTKGNKTQAWQYSRNPTDGECLIVNVYEPPDLTSNFSLADIRQKFMDLNLKDSGEKWKENLFETPLLNLNKKSLRMERFDDFLVPQLTRKQSVKRQEYEKGKKTIEELNDRLDKLTNKIQTMTLEVAEMRIRETENETKLETQNELISELRQRLSEKDELIEALKTTIQHHKTMAIAGIPEAIVGSATPEDKEKKNGES